MKRKHLLLTLLMALAVPLAMWGQESLPYEYGFENNDLAGEGWTRNSLSSNTNISSNAKRTGNYGFRFNYNADPQYLITPELLTTSGGVTVEFYYKTSSMYFPRTFQVGYSTTTTDISAFVFGDEITASDAEWVLSSQDFPAGTKYVAIKHENTSYGNLYLDDFNFEECSEYPAPKNLVLTAYTSSTATLDWTPRTGQDHWDIYYSTSNVAPDAGTTPQVSNTETKPHTLTGLTPGETYYAYVRGNYNNGEHYSDWSNACSFEVGCFTPNVSYSQATCNQVYFSWTPVGAEASWQVAFSEQQGFDPNEVTLETVTMQYYVKEDLTTGVTYYARVRAVCGAGDYSDWSDEVSMTTECLAPTNLRESGVTPTTATLTWNLGSNESQWQISYSTTENFTPESGTIVTVNTKPYTLANLTVNTQYYAYVRAVCGDNIYSNWSGICAFMPKYELTVSNDETNYNGYAPFYTYGISYTAKSQFIIPSSDLTTILYGNISKLSFYATSETASFGDAMFDVFISELDGITVFNDYEFFDWDDMTKVYSGSVSVSGNKMEISLNEPYQYMGGDMLIGFAQTASGSGNYPYWYGAVTTGYSTYGGYEASYGSNYSRQKFIPKTTFCYTPGTAPTCMKPKNLASSNVDATSATLTWTKGADETNWVLQYGTSEAFGTGTYTEVSVNGDPTKNLTGLSPETVYYARVKADCGGDDYSAWSNVCSFTPSAIQTIVVNNGSETSYNVPFYGYYVNSQYLKSQFIIPSTELVNVENQHITKLTFHTGVYYSTASFPDGVFKVYLSPTELTEFSTSSPVDWSTLTEVYNGSLSVSNNQMEITLSAPYLYTSGNLLVGFEETSLSSSANFVEWLGVTTDYYASYYYAGYNDREMFLPKMTIEYNTAITVCSVPTNLNINATANSATLTWTAGNEETNWNVQYKAVSALDWSEVIAVEDTPTYTINGLSPTTDYEVRVQADCGNSASSWLTSDPFQTACDYMALPYSHNFDSDAIGQVAPTCWYFSDGQYHRIYESTSMANSGSNFLLMQKPNESACYVALPAINTIDNPINTLKLSFWARLWNSTYMSMYLSIGVMTDPNDIDTYQFITSVNVRDSYSLYEVYFDNYVGEGQYIVFRCYNTSNYYCIDDIEVSLAPTCRQPLELSGGYSYNAHEANIRWKTRDLRQCNYQVSYSTTEGFNPEEGTIVDVEFENTLVNAGTDYRYYDLTCLNANTTYYFYVRANCGNGDFSEWSDDYASITTGEACLGPDNVMVDAKNTFVKFEWNGDIDTEWEFQYKESSSEEWITPADFVITPGYELYLTYTLHGLTPGKEYNARLRKHCGMYSCPEVDDGYSDWYELYFSTYDGCWDGDPWMCTSHLGTQATLRWSNNAPDMRWQIRYRLSNEYDYPEGNIVMTEVLPEASLQQYTVTDLLPNSTYYWQVRGYCDEESQSDWSDEDYFFTRSTDDYITVDKAHPYYEDFEDGMPEDWSRMNLYNYNLEHYDTWQRIESSSGTWESFPPSYCISSCRECMSWASPGSMILMPAIHIDENATSAVLSFWSKDAFNDSDARGTKLIWVNGNYLSTDYTAFDLGCVYQKGSKAGYWRQCFVNLDDYIGQTVIIAFDYVVTHNYNNYDWWVDNVRLQVFDKVGGNGENVTSGDWNNGDFWGGSVPSSDDDVIINANVTIPEGVVAEANQIIINTDTVNMSDSKVQKFGKLIIADGGQLKVNNEVETTMQKTINAYTRGGNGWYLIASPVQEELDPEDVEGVVTTEGTYDLYAFDGSQQDKEWRNYKQSDNAIVFQNGQGYLYANSLGNTPNFTGTVLPSNQTKEVDLDYAGTTFGAWNLVGNPFTCNAYLSGNRPFYRLVETNEDSKIMLATDYVIAPMEGVFVQAADDDDAVTFTTTMPAPGQSMSFSLRKVNTTKDGVSTGSTTLDRARIQFGEGQNFGHLDLMADPNRLYIPMMGKDMSVVHCQPAGELPLNFEAAVDGTFCLSFENEAEGLMYCHLIDNLTGADIDLLQQSEYIFNAKVGDYASRFKVVFAAACEDADGDDETFAFYSNGSWVIANPSTGSGSATLQVIDLNGRILSCEQIEGCTNINFNAAPGIYLLRLINGDNVKVQKVVVR
jgi:hypothetical protein